MADTPPHHMPNPNRGGVVRRKPSVYEASPITVQVPPIRQQTSWTCGAAVVAAICDLFNVGPEDEAAYIDDLKATPELGTEPEAIASFLRSRGLQVDARNGMTLDDLRTHLAAGHPVIVAFQAWDDLGDYSAGDDGHYAIIIGCDGHHVYFADPSMGSTARGYLPHAEFVRRWHDYGADGEAFRQWGCAAWLERSVAVVEGDLVAKSGRAGTAAEEFMERAIRRGARVLYRITRDAVRRHMERGVEFMTAASSLYTDEERQQLANLFAAIIGTARMLSRASVLDRARRVRRRRGLAEGRVMEAIDAPATPLPPQDAVDYFRRLVPTLGTDPQRFGALMERHALTLAVATETAVLSAVQSAIVSRLETGTLSTGTQVIADILVDAGIAPRNPQYAEMVFRTNAMDAYNQAADEARTDPEVIGTFPVWQYSSVADERSRPHHAARDGNYYPARVSFADVRGTGIEDAANCRCTAIPIDAWTWRDLKDQGATIAAGYPDVPVIQTT